MLHKMTFLAKHSFVVFLGCFLFSVQSAYGQFNVSSDTTICVGDSTTLTASGATTYNWSPATGLNVTTGAMVTAKPNDTTLYKVVFDLGLPTEDSLFVKVNMNPLPSAAFTVSTDSVCSGQSFSLYAPGGASYAWKVGTNVLSALDTFTTTPSASASYKLVAELNGCSDSAAKNITVLVPGDFTITQNKTAMCVSQSATMAVTNSSLSYKWVTTADLSDTVGTSNTVTSNSTTNTSGFINVSITSTDQNGCTRTKSAGIIVSSLFPDTPLIVIDDTLICNGLSTEIRASSGSAGGATYTWTPTNGLATPNSSATTASPSSTTTYTVTVDRNGCARSNSITLEVLPSPTISITQSSNGATLCMDEPDSIEIVSPTAVKYFWSGGITSAYNQKAFLPGKTVTLNLGVEDAAGCTNYSSVTINVDTSCGVPVGIIENTSEPVAISKVMTNEISVSLSNGWNLNNVTVSLIDITGKSLDLPVKTEEQNVSIQTATLNQGIYILQVNDGENQHLQKIYIH